jgi:hypothetical protein
MQNNDQRRIMNTRVLILIVLLLTVIILIFSNFGQNHSTVVYDCRLSEISPDYPIEVKEECRRLRLEMWLKEQEDARRKTMI